MLHWSEWASSRNLDTNKQKSLETINDRVIMEEREPSYTFGDTANWYRHYGEQCESSFKK